jgi:ABC-2 type transport system permease protein
MQLGFLFLLPNILLSGFMFPRNAMSEPAHWLGSSLPLTYYLEILRGVLLKGIGFAHLWQEGLILALFAIALVTLSVNRFSKTIE